MSITNARRQMEHNHTRDHQLVRGLQEQSSRRARRDVIAPTTRSQTAGGKVSSVLIPRTAIIAINSEARDHVTVIRIQALHWKQLPINA